MTYKRYIALIEFHVSGDQSIQDSFTDKILSLSQSDWIQLKNTIPIYERV